MMEFEKSEFNKDESFLLAKFDENGSGEVLFDHLASTPRRAASLSKVFLALEVANRLSSGEIKNRPVDIIPEMVSQYGTNALGEIARGNNVVKVDINTLILLMLKFSCNSSTDILAMLLPEREKLQDQAKKDWGLSQIKLADKFGEVVNEFSVLDIYKVYSEIYFPKESGVDFEIVKEGLKKSRNIYYLFDQININIIGSKSGTLNEGGNYWIGDSGIIKVDGNLYFVGGIVKNKSISAAVLRMREIGKKLISSLPGGQYDG